MNKTLIVIALIVLSANCAADKGTAWASIAGELKTCVTTARATAPNIVIVEANANIANYYILTLGSATGTAVNTYYTEATNRQIETPATTDVQTELIPECLGIEDSSDNADQYYNLLKRCLKAGRVVFGTNGTVNGDEDDCFTKWELEITAAVDAHIKTVYERKTCLQKCTTESEIKLTGYQSATKNFWSRQLSSCLGGSETASNDATQVESREGDVESSWECVQFWEAQTKFNLGTYGINNQVSFLDTTQFVKEYWGNQQSCRNWCLNTIAYHGSRMDDGFDAELKCENDCYETYLSANNMDNALIVDSYVNGASIISFAAVALVLLALF